MNLKEFFGDSKILITGASGFIGRNLYETLKKEGLNVIGTYYTRKLEGLIQCDLTNYSQVEKIMEGVDYVFMLATNTYGAGVMKNNPNILIRGNLYLNSNTLELAWKNKVKKLMFISSSTVYQEANYPLAEEDLDLNKEPFKMYMGVGWVKRYTEKLCKFYGQQGLNINIVRPTGIYGKYDKYEEGKSHFMPAIIKRVLDEQNPLIIWGTGYSMRNMIYIDDFIRDILKVFLNYNECEPLNICSDEVYNIKDIVEIILNYVNTYISPIYDSTKPDAIPYRNLNRNKFDSLLGQEFYIPLEEGINNTIEWLKTELGEPNGTNS